MGCVARISFLHRFTQTQPESVLTNLKQLESWEFVLFALLKPCMLIKILVEKSVTQIGWHICRARKLPEECLQKLSKEFLP